VLLAVTVNDNRFQHLAGAFNSIIAMMLASIRARGLRGLIDLPKTILLGLYLRRLGKEFAALIASLDLGALPLPIPPAPQPAPAPPAEPGSTTPSRPRLAAHPGANRARPAAAAQPIPAAPKPPARRTRTPQPTRHQAFARPRRAPDPRAIPGLRATGRRS
jgi:hypothetical protein